MKQQLPVLLTCAGMCHEAELAEDIAQSLYQQGKVDKVSVVAITAGSCIHQQKVKEASSIVVFDGCALNCAKLSLEKLAISDVYHFDISKLLQKVSCVGEKPSLLESLQVTQMINHTLFSVLPKQYSLGKGKGASEDIIAIFPCADR
ncbi:putative zinc-binding protein [Pseudoalteromonas sp. L1]|uniref:putative zinc-binding protein n=1 Tax=Pseudoalteromonas sp. L1 TaxID=195716 RepID=UPI001F1E8F79|nr:putative zinc-binding protein [Pseudoalteromonas sp. L1]